MQDKTTANINRSARRQLWFLKSIIFVSICTVILHFAYSFLFLTPSYGNLIESITEKEAVRVAHHIAKHLLPQNEKFTKTTIPKIFDERYQEVVRDFNLMKVKIYSPSGEIIFSTTAEEIGEVNTEKYFHGSVKSGKPYTKIVQKNTKSLENQMVTVDVVETYVPVMDGDTFLGAFEIYFDTTTTKNTVDRLVLTANILLVAISCGLLLAMVALVLKAKSNILAQHKAEHKILRQSVSLQRKNRELSTINAISEIINGSKDLTNLLTGTLEVLAKQFGPKNNIRGTITLLSENKLELESHFGHTDEFIKRHEQQNIDECLCEKAAKNGEMVISCGKCSTAVSAECPEDKSRRTIVPLKSKNEVIGILSLHIPDSLDIGTNKNMLQTIGNQLGLAISNLKLFMETKKQSLVDPLTGLGNRRNLDAHTTRFISVARRHKTPLTLVMTDIDYFKNYNDTYGHAKGDEILVKVANILKKEIRDIDFVARYGGEEFVILLSKTGTQQAILVCERIRKTVEKDTDVTISLGIALFQPDSDEKALIREADMALYRAKDKGRNQVAIAQQS